MFFSFNILFSILSILLFTQARSDFIKSEEQFNKIRCKINQLRTERKSPIYPLGKLDFLDEFIKANLLKWDQKDKYSNRNFLILLKDRLTKNDIPYYKVSQVISETIDLDFTTSQLFADNSVVYKHLVDPSYTVSAGGFVPFGKKYLFILILLETDTIGASLPTCPPYFEPVPLKLGKITNPRYAHFDPIPSLKFFFHGNNTHFPTYSHISESKRAHPFTRIASLNMNPTLHQFIYPKRLDSEPLDFVKLICIINYLRQTSLHKVNPVSADITLMSVARNHTEYLARTGLMTNYDLNNHSVGERLLAQKFPWLAYGQNVARGYKTEWEVIDVLMKSSYHRDIILNPSYNHIGAWKVPRGHYWTILFASITPSSNLPPEHCLKFNKKKLDQYQ